MFERPKLRSCLLGCVVLVASGGFTTGAAADAEAVLNARCAACHERLPDGGLSRITEMRKTPEGWDMVVVRMMLVHGVKVTPDERRELVKHLADTQGLAPAESAEWRYILEREPNAIESAPDDDLVAMCARCHSYARVALQRRDTDEWTKLAHFHLGQYPTTEYQALGRDRNWWDIASNEVPDKLGKLYPFETDAWTQWQQHTKADPAGEWRVAGHRPGKGQYQGVLTVSGGDDRYDVSFEGSYADGETFSGAGAATVYTGYEWRARLRFGGDTVLQVAALSEDGTTLSGRWFLEDSDALGARLHAVRAGGGAQILSVQPPYLRRGESATVSIHGVGLSGEVDVGPGVDIVQQISADPQTVVVELSSGNEAQTGARTLSVGAAKADGALAIYDKVDSVRVEPDYAIARVGAEGGPLAPVPAQFDAVAYANGEDGEPGTDDDVRIGVMPAEWRVENFNEVAAAMKDTEYVGVMSAGGLFMPAGAGLNTERKYSTNNAGDLAVKAVVKDGGGSVEGDGHLVVTVQRWNDPPIR